MNKNHYRFNNKLLFFYFLIVAVVTIIIAIYFTNLYLMDYFLITSCFILLIIQLYKDTIIPMFPKLIVLFFNIIIALTYIIGREGFNFVFIGFFILFSYSITENHYNINKKTAKSEYNVNNLTRNELLKRDISIFFKVLGGVILSIVVAFVSYGIIQCII